MVPWGWGWVDTPMTYFDLFFFSTIQIFYFSWRDKSWFFWKSYIIHNHNKLTPIFWPTFLWKLKTIPFEPAQTHIADRGVVHFTWSLIRGGPPTQRFGTMLHQTCKLKFSKTNLRARGRVTESWSTWKLTSQFYHESFISNNWKHTLVHFLEKLYRSVSAI